MRSHGKLITLPSAGEGHVTAPNCSVIKSLEEVKRKAFNRDPKCGFYILGCRLQVPIIFHAILVGSHYPFNRHRIPSFLPDIITHFSRFTPIFTQILPVSVRFIPILAVCMLWAALLSPSLKLTKFVVTIK